MEEINLVCDNHKLLELPMRYRNLYLLDDMLSYGKPFILDRAIPQEKGILSSQIARLQLWYDRVVMSRHDNTCLIKSEYNPERENPCTKKHV